MDPVAIKVLSNLKGTRYACSSLSLVSGGNANFTYRGNLLSPLTDDTYSPETIIVKHAEPYIASNPEWELDVGRSVGYFFCHGISLKVYRNSNPLC